MFICKTNQNKKDMYKNAEKVLNDYNTMSKSVMRSAIAKTRIEQNLSKIKSMIHLIEPSSHHEVVIPKNSLVTHVPTSSSGNNKNKNDEEESNENENISNFENIDEAEEYDEEEANKHRTEHQKMRLRLLKSASLVPTDLTIPARPLDRNSINHWLKKVRNANENDIRPASTSNFALKNFQNNNKKNKRKEVLSVIAINQLEKKMQVAIRAEYRTRHTKLIRMQQQEVNNDTSTSTSTLPTTSGATASLSSSNKKTIMNTKSLLPFYTLEDIHHFMDIFSTIDENFSGDLDVTEWIKLFQSLDASMPTHEARMIFMKIDKDGSGSLSMKELVPVVFNRANKEQQKIITQYAEQELTRKNGENIAIMTTTELTQLFEAYDLKGMGFIDVSMIKDRIKSFSLNEHVLFHFLDSMADLADDEMINLIEFLRLFKTITGAPGAQQKNN